MIKKQVMSLLFFVYCAHIQDDLLVVILSLSCEESYRLEG